MSDETHSIRRRPRPEPLWDLPEPMVVVDEYMRAMHPNTDPPIMPPAHAGDSRELAAATRAIMTTWVESHTGGMTLDHRYAWRCLASHFHACMARQGVAIDLEARALRASRERERFVHVVEVAQELELVEILHELARRLYGEGRPRAVCG